MSSLDTMNDSSVSIIIRRTQGFDILMLMLMLMLMSWPSSLAHKLLMLKLMLASLVRIGLENTARKRGGPVVT